MCFVTPPKISLLKSDLSVKDCKKDTTRGDACRAGVNAIL